MVVVGSLCACDRAPTTDSPSSDSKAPLSRAAAPHAPDGGVEGVCTVRPDGVLKVKSKINGEVLAVNVKVGDRVQAGDVLVELSTRDLKVERERLQIAMEQARTRRELVQMRLARADREAEATRQLYSDAGLAKEHDAQREQQLALAQIQLELKDLSLRDADIARQIREAAIRATAPATVLARQVEPGQIVGAAYGMASGGDVLLELGDTNRLVLDCAVHAAESAAVRPGMPLEIVRDEREAHGVVATVSRIAPQIETVGGVAQLRFSARFEMSAPADLLPGARVTARLSARTEKEP